MKITKKIKEQLNKTYSTWEEFDVEFKKFFGPKWRYTLEEERDDFYFYVYSPRLCGRDNEAYFRVCSMKHKILEDITFQKILDSEAVKVAWREANDAAIEFKHKWMEKNQKKYFQLPQNFS